jgi:hypothetical protein
MMPGTGSARRYGAASLCLGLIAVWGSENLFWTVPAAPLKPWEWLATWLAYSIAAAAALSAVLWSGLGGWRAAFSGGAILGWAVEGVVVATMYDAFPVQIVWTGLAWHALLTGLAVFWLPRVLAGESVLRQIGALALLGLFGAVWGLYWPSERDGMPGYGTAFAYLAGLGLTVVLAQAGLDRIGPLSAPRPAVLVIAPVLLAAGWVARVALAPSVVLLACPVMVAATVWIMGRLGRRGAPLSFGPRPALWRHALFLVAPVITAGLVVPAWGLFGAVAVNIPVAVLSGVLSFCLWFWLLAEALRAGRRPA